MRRCWGSHPRRSSAQMKHDANPVRTTTWLSVPLVSGAPKGMAAPMWAALRMSSSQGTSSAMLPQMSWRTKVQGEQGEQENIRAKATGERRKPKGTFVAALYRHGRCASEKRCRKQVFGLRLQAMCTEKGGIAQAACKWATAGMRLARVWRASGLHKFLGGLSALHRMRPCILF